MGRSSTYSASRSPAVSRFALPQCPPARARIAQGSVIRTALRRSSPPMGHRGAGGQRLIREGCHSSLFDQGPGVKPLCLGCLRRRTVGARGSGAASLAGRLRPRPSAEAASRPSTGVRCASSRPTGARVAPGPSSRPVSPRREPGAAAGSGSTPRIHAVERAHTIAPADRSINGAGPPAGGHTLSPPPAGPHGPSPLLSFLGGAEMSTAQPIAGRPPASSSLVEGGRR
jgi:hypothetical protein